MLAYPQPYVYVAVLAENDSTDLDPIPNAVWIGGTGNLVIQNMNGDTVTINSVPAGTLLPIQVKRLMVASTVTNVVGLK